MTAPLAVAGTAFSYSFEEGSWDGAEVFEWYEGEGNLIGRATFGDDYGDNPKMRVVTVRIEARGTTLSRVFYNVESPKALLAQATPWIWEMRSR